MDNFYNQCPPMMSDGRHFTDYKTATRRNEYIKYINTVNRDDTYRLFLQNNANQIMDNIWDHHLQNDRCWVNPCIHNYPTRSLPHHFAAERQAFDNIAAADFTSQQKNMGCNLHNDYRMNTNKKVQNETK